MTNTDGSNTKRNCWVSGLHKIFASAEDLATCTVVDAYKDQVNEYTVIYVVCDSQDEAIFGNEYKTGTKWIIANKTIFGGNSIAQVESYIVGVGSSYSWGENSFNVSTSESILNYNIKKGAVLKFPDNVLRRVNNIDGTTFTVDKKLTTTDSSATLYKLYGISYGAYSCARGEGSTASGHYSNAEGSETIAYGVGSHAEGRFTTTSCNAEHAQGSYNVSHKATDNFDNNAGNTLHSIGIGTDENTQSNAVEVMQNADVYIKGVGGYDGVHIKSEAGYETVKTLQQVINGKQDVLTAGQNIVITNNTISAVIDAGFQVEVVQTLPETGEANTIYFISKEGGANPDVYDEYMYINNTWEKIGSTEVDLTNYYNKTEVDGLLSDKQATLTAGNNITINGNTISANDTTYSAGANIEITDNAIKAVGYIYDPNTGAFTNGDRDIVYSGTTYYKPSATGVMAHAEGNNTKAIGRSSHAEGSSTKANGNNSHAEGYNTETGGNYTTNTKTAGTATGAGVYAHAEGNATIATGIGAHAEGRLTLAKGNTSHAEGDGCSAKGNQSHAEGSSTIAIGLNSHAEGRQAIANGFASHAEGCSETGGNYTTNTKNTGAETSAGAYAHAEGNATIANGLASHSEGYKTLAKGAYSHAEGHNTVAKGVASHAEGESTTAIGNNSHAEGSFTVASGDNSHSGGEGTIAQGNNQTAIGKYNISDSTSLFIVGNGTSSVRSNAMKLDASGNLSLAGRFMGDDGGTHIGDPLNNYFIYLDEDTRCEHSIMGDNDGVTWKITNTGTGTGFDSITASNGFFQSSDIRKKNILGDLDLDKAYNLIDKCQTILYSLKDDDSSKEQIGLIAQEVQEFFPEIVSVDDNGFFSLDYARLTVVILKVLKDLILRISVLEKMK